MLSYLKKFNELPKELREKVSSPLVMRNIKELEEKYNIDLAIVVMKVMAKDIAIPDLSKHLNNDLRLSESDATKLVKELKAKVFLDVKTYLGIQDEPKSIKRFSNFDPSFPSSQTLDNGSDDDYLFSPEDEEEIRELTKKINGYNKFNKSTNAVDEVDLIVEEVNIDFGSDYLKQRFRDIVSTYLRGVRDRIDTRLALSKPFDEGGLGFDNESVDKVLSVTDKHSNKDTAREIPPKMKVIEDSKIDVLDNIGTRDVDYYLKKALEEREDNNKNEKKPVDIEPASVATSIKKEVTTDKKETAKPVIEKTEELPKQKSDFLKKLDVEHELAPPPPKVIVKAKEPVSNEIKKEASSIQVVKTKKIEKEDSLSKKAKSLDKDLHQIVDNQISPPPPSVIKKPSSFGLFKKDKKKTNPKDELFEKEIQKKVKQKTNIPTGQSGKKIMKDVSVIPRVMSPIDELKFMDLITFRRLGSNISDITEKINNKIKLLEEDNYNKRIEGIKAWRKSPVNRLYLTMGEESIGNNKSINAIIEERLSKKQDCLTSDEFETIMDLNKSLRF